MLQLSKLLVISNCIGIQCYLFDIYMAIRMIMSLGGPAVLVATCRSKSCARYTGLQKWIFGECFRG